MPRSTRVNVQLPARSGLIDVLHHLAATWRRARARREAFSCMIEAGPRLVIDAGWDVADAETGAGRPVWRSPHLPPLPRF